MGGTIAVALETAMILRHLGLRSNSLYRMWRETIHFPTSHSQISEYEGNAMIVVNNSRIRSS